MNILFVRLIARLTPPTPVIEPGGRMRCAISSMSSVSVTLGTRPRCQFKMNIMQGGKQRVARGATLTVSKGVSKKNTCIIYCFQIQKLLYVCYIFFPFLLQTLTW